MGAGGWISTAVRIVAWAEESTLVGFAGARVVGVERKNLWDSTGRLFEDCDGFDGVAEVSRKAGCDGARTFVGRTDEDGVDRCPAPQTARAFFGRANDRARCHFAKN